MRKILFILLLLLAPACAWATDIDVVARNMLYDMISGTTFYPRIFYVSSSGNDSNDGLSPTTPWASINKVNNGTYAPGTTIAFSGNLTGCISLTYTNVPKSTTIAGITLTSYGSTKATLTANCTNAAILLDGINSATVSNLIIRGASSGAAFGVAFQNSSGQPIYNLNVFNSDIAEFYPPGGNGNTGNGNVGSSEIALLGINLGSTVIFATSPLCSTTTGGPQNVGMSNITISGNTLHGDTLSSNDFGGISGNGCFLTGTTPNVSNLTITNNTIFNLGAYPNSNFTSRPNYQAVVGDGGIVPHFWTGASITHNLIYFIGLNISGGTGGGAALWTWYADTLDIEYNDINDAQNGGPDGTGVDLDEYTSFTTVAHNYIHDSAGTGVNYCPFITSVLGQPWGNNTIAFNVIAGNGWLSQSPQIANYCGLIAAMSTWLKIYNNTIYDAYSTYCFGIGADAAWPIGSLIENNICYSASNDEAIVGKAGQTLSNVSLDYNNYSTGAHWTYAGSAITTLAGWQSATGQEAHSNVSAAGFVATLQIGNSHFCTPVGGTMPSTGPQPCPYWFQLTSASAQLGAGVAITGTLPFTYYQAQTPIPPNIGAY